MLYLGIDQHRKQLTVSIQRVASLRNVPPSGMLDCITCSLFVPICFAPICYIEQLLGLGQ